MNFDVDFDEEFSSLMPRFDWDLFADIELFLAESGRTRAPAPVRFHRWTAPPYPGYPFKPPLENDYEWRSQMPPASYRDSFDTFQNGDPFALPSPNSSPPESPYNNSSWPQSPAASPFSSHSSPFSTYNPPSPSPNFRGYHHRRSSPPMPPLHLPPPHVQHQYGPAANMRQENNSRWDRQPPRPRRADYNFPARARKRARSYGFTNHHIPTAKRSHQTHIEPRTSVKPLRRPEIAVKSVQREDYPFELGSGFWPEPVPTENVDLEPGASTSPLSQRISPKDKISWQGSPPSYTTLNNMVSLRERSRTTLSTQKALAAAGSKSATAKSATSENLDVVDSSPDLPPEEKIWTDLESSFRELFSPWIEGPGMTELEKLIQERKSQIVYTDQQNTHVLRHGIRTLVDDFRAMLTNLSTDRIREEDFLKKFVGSFSDKLEGPVDDLFMSDDTQYDVGLHRQDEIFLQTIRSALLNSVQMLNDRVPYIGPVYL